MNPSLVMGSFTTPAQVLAAVGVLRGEGREGLEIYSAFPLDGAEEALGLPRSRMPPRVLAGALVGAATGLLLQWWCNAIDFPINVGGRPLLSFPSWIPISFELAILFGSFGAFFGLLSLLGLPRLHHPVFALPGFRSVASDRFWMSAAAAGEADEQSLERALRALGAEEVAIVKGPA